MQKSEYSTILHLDFYNLVDYISDTKSKWNILGCSQSFAWKRCTITSLCNLIVVALHQIVEFSPLFKLLSLGECRMIVGTAFQEFFLLSLCVGTLFCMFFLLPSCEHRFSDVWSRGDEQRCTNALRARRVALGVAMCVSFMSSSDFALLLLESLVVLQSTSALVVALRLNSCCPDVMPRHELIDACLDASESAKRALVW